MGTEHILNLMSAGTPSFQSLHFLIPSTLVCWRRPNSI